MLGGRKRRSEIFGGREKFLPTTETRNPDLPANVVVATLLRMDDKIVGKSNAGELI